MNKMRWLRWIALLIFVFLTAYGIPFLWKNPSIGNLIIVVIFIAITIWVAIGFFPKRKQTS
jgi:hypothetical protein